MRAILSMLLEVYRPLTYGLPMALYRCPTPTLTVQTDQGGDEAETR